jgi:sulfur-carrier protein adenylyltransferase/sulfurtransferase
MSESAKPGSGADLSNDEIHRYSRHLILPEVGIEGQRKLKQARILLVGTGGLGSPAAMYLAAAGVGTLGLIDFDVVDVTNLQRQIIHGTKDVGRKKIDSAMETLKDLNPHTKLIAHETALTSENALEIIRDYDMVVDGTDNFPTRYLVNDACVLLGKPNVYGSIFRFEGQVTVLCTPDGPCYRCMYPEPPPPGLVPSCAEGGVLGILPGVVGCLQATEAVKLILGIGNTLIGRLLTYNALDMSFRTFKVRRDPEWPVNAPHPSIKELIDYAQFCGVPHGSESPQAEAAPVPEVTPVELKAKLDNGAGIVLIDVREIHEHQICNIRAATLMPLGTLPQRLGELDPGREVIVHCKSGMRSAKACGILRDAGFRNVWNLKGGILAWSDQVDPSVPKY